MKKGALIDTTFNRYEVLEQAGCGGSGEVYKVKSSDNSIFAAKILRAGLPLKQRNRFKNEIAFCQKEIHPGIIKVIDHGIIGDQPFYVMPFYERKLRLIIDGSIDNKKKLEVFVSILDAIEAAHLAGCWHRDLKPENILMDNNDSAIITDFGIAHFQETDLVAPVETSHVDRLANFQYAAPEQRRKGGNADHRADIFALGLILNELFTLTVPQGTDFRKVASIDESIDYLDKIIDKMIANDPEKRYQAIEKIKIDLIRERQLKIELQSYDALKKKVIPSAELSHPLIQSPVKILSCDHTGAELIVELNHDIPEEWIHAFYSRGAKSYSSWHNPEMVAFHGNKIVMRTPIDHADEAVRYVKEWIANTNRVFPEIVREIQTRVYEDKKRELVEVAERERKRLEFLEKVKNIE